MEGERYSANRHFFAYAKGYVNLIAGEFRADYHQGQSFDASVVNTNWKAGRIMPTFDLELGLGWMSKCETWRISGGYLLSAWTNVVKTDEFIDRVRRNNFVDMGDAMTFDGLTLRVEGRF